ncbi:MAG: hypothetical protein VYA86_02570 [Candidatus Thermoplasmatota archaeon]|nr:hypothetical protein [Candidatus Thermoplasmatota archaeon]
MSKLLTPFKNWWEEQRERHLFILGTLSFISFTMVMWSIVFFFFLDGAQVSDLEHLRNWTWAGLFVGFTALIFIGPEFIHYQSQWSYLMETLNTTSRAELGRERKDAEEAAKTLGSVWSARLKVHYIEHGLLRGRSAPAEAENTVPEDLLINWWGTDDSHLSRLVSIDLFREHWFNRSMAFVGLSGLLLQLYNMFWGLATSENGTRENTLHIWEYLNGLAPGSYASPYFDDISGWLFLLITAVLIWFSYPASGERPEPPVTEEEE